MRICKSSEIQEGELYRFEVNEKPLLVARQREEFIVAAAICTHEEADLTLGILTGKTVTCPLHQAKFDLETGSVLAGPDGGSPNSIPALRVYATRVQNDELFADI